MSTINIDAERITQAASTASHSAATLHSEVDRLMHQLRALQECWTGTASAGFQTVVADWQQVQAKVHESLTQIQKALALAGQQYAEVENANAKLFRG